MDHDEIADKIKEAINQFNEKPGLRWELLMSPLQEIIDSAPSRLKFDRDRISITEYNKMLLLDPNFTKWQER